MGLSHGNHTAALPPMWLGDFETAQQAQNAVMAFQPHPPQLAEHWHGVQRADLDPIPVSCVPESLAAAYPYG
ncbi:hypothetical protein LH991_15755 [Schleiferilactobacillus harbinensis]|nr:hypothetical protein LH991_15755 [Schleiferilactobacillus harbinensis]